MDLYSYLKQNLERRDPYPAIEHTLRAELHQDGRISFYIHATGRDSNTADFWVSDAGLFPKHEPLSKQAEFLTHPKEVRDAKLAVMSAENTGDPAFIEDLRPTLSEATGLRDGPCLDLARQLRDEGHTNLPPTRD